MTMLAALVTVAALSLPRGAKIIEIERIPPSVRKDRALVLWMKTSEAALRSRLASYATFVAAMHNASFRTSSTGSATNRRLGTRRIATTAVVMGER